MQGRPPKETSEESCQDQNVCGKQIEKQLLLGNCANSFQIKLNRESPSLTVGSMGVVQTGFIVQVMLRAA